MNDDTVRVGSYVCFKSDVEQCAKVVKILGHGKNKILTVEAPDGGFKGMYIRDQETHTLALFDAWTE